MNSRMDNPGDSRALSSSRNNSFEHRSGEVFVPTSTRCYRTEESYERSYAPSESSSREMSSHMNITPPSFDEFMQQANDGQNPAPKPILLVLPQDPPIPSPGPSLNFLLTPPQSPPLHTPQKPIRPPNMPSHLTTPRLLGITDFDGIATESYRPDYSRDQNSFDGMDSNISHGNSPPNNLNTEEMETSNDLDETVPTQRRAVADRIQANESSADGTFPVRRRRIVENNDFEIIYDYNHGLPW